MQPISEGSDDLTLQCYLNIFEEQFFATSSDPLTRSFAIVGMLSKRESSFEALRDFF